MNNQTANFYTEAPRELKRLRVGPRRWPYFVLSIFLLLIIVGIIAVPYALVGYDAYGDAQAGRVSLEKAQVLAAELKLDEAKVHTDDAVEHFTAASRKFSSFKILFWVPWAGKQIKAIDSVLVSGRETSKAISELLDLAQDILEVFEYSEEVTEGLVPEVEETRSYMDLSREEKREILQRIYESGPRLEEALIRIDLATESFNQIPQGDLAAPLREAIAPFAEKMPEFKKQLSLAVPIVKIVPQLAGYPESKTYLFLLSNNAELRPAGGFIGTYGILKVADGEFVNFDTHDVYAIDGPSEEFLHVTPPPPIHKYLKVNNWYMRDSNWSPDFPTAAEKTLWFYSEEANGISQHRGAPIPEAPLVNFNGVISINPTLVADLLGVVGPITIDNQTFNSENLIDVLEYQVEVAFLAEGIPRAQRKEIIAVLADELMDRLFNLPASQWIDVIQIMEKRLEDKHMIVYEKDPDIQDALVAQNWAGEVIQTDGDYVLVIDANLASLKTDPFVERDIKYNLSFNENNELEATVTIHYKNTATFTWKTTRYRTYTRVYAPEGSEIISVAGHLRDDRLANPNLEPGEVDVYDELGKTVFGAFTSIEPGREGELVFRYKLPEDLSKDILKGNDYNLYFQKQAGTAGHGLTLELEFDKNLKQATPPELEADWGDQTYYLETDIGLDRRVDIEFK